jgi:hypothetical protein
MHQGFEKSRSAVRFGTEKSVGFPTLNGIFDNVTGRDSNASCGRDGGVSRTQVELSKC